MNKLCLLLIGMLSWSWSPLAATGSSGLKYVEDDPVLNAHFAKGEITIAPDVDLSDGGNLVLYYDASAPPEAWPEILELASRSGNTRNGPDVMVIQKGKGMGRDRGGGSRGGGGGFGGGGFGGADGAMRRYCVSMGLASGYSPMQTKKGTRWIRSGCTCFPNPAIHMLEQASHSFDRAVYRAHENAIDDRFANPHMHARAANHSACGQREPPSAR